MGLDIYFNKAKRSRVKATKEKIAELNKQLDQELVQHTPDRDKIYSLKEELDQIDPWEEIAYFRKVNFLVGFFNYVDNCSEVEISKEQIENLVNTCEQVLEDNSLAETLLPTTEGFFFGRTEYDEYYFEKVEDTLHIFREILENLGEDEIVLMYCWW